jgi:hypothetical protein
VKGLFTPALLVAALSISGCELTLDEKEKLDNAAADLQQLTDQIIITYPAKDSEVSDSIVTVRADIPASAQAQEVWLLVDGIEIAKDSDGAPWEIQWPAYLFADGGKHTLLLKTITGEGNEVRNNEQFQLTVSEQANKALTFEEGINGKSIQDQGSLSFTFNEFEGASGYEILIDGDYDNILISNTAEIELNNLSVGNHTVQYRVLHDRLDSTPFSEEISFEVLPAALPTTNEPVINGINVTLSWEPIAEGDSYEVYWGEEGFIELLKSTSSTTFTISELGIGYFEWSIRRANALGQQSAMSPLGAVELLPPVLPSLNDPIVEKQENGYQVTLSWEDVAEGDSFEIYWGRKGNSVSLANTTDSSFVITGIELDKYEYSLKKTNALGQTSNMSELMPIEVGTFRTQIGGSGDDTAHKFITSSLGGYLILARTKSPDISSTLNGIDDWIIHIGENGGVVSEFISSTTTGARFSDIYETENGSIYLAGYDSGTEGGVIVKLNSDLELIWEEHYNPENQTDTYRFKSITEWNGGLYVMASQSGRYTFDNFGDYRGGVELFLHSVDQDNGNISAPIILPTIPGMEIYDSSDAIVLENGNLLISGGGVIDLNGNAAPRGFFSIIDNNFNSVANWVSEGSFFDMVFYHDTVKLSDGKFTVIGSAQYSADMVKTFNEDGSFFRDYFIPLDAGDLDTVAPIAGGRYLSFYQPWPYGETPWVIVEVSEDGAKSEIAQETEHSSPVTLQTSQVDLVSTSERSVTMLFSKKTIDKNEYDIVIKKVPITNE